ncbi:MAG: response regulator transcription factor [bacterium]|nr:response regulator transcription factor [bacterium]
MRKLVLGWTNPVDAAGFEAVCAKTESLEFQAAMHNITAAGEAVAEIRPDIVLFDSGLDRLQLLAAIAAIAQQGRGTGIVVWEDPISSRSAFGYVRAGARGYLAKTAGILEVVACLSAVAEGRFWMQDNIGTPKRRLDRLTQRELQVLEGVRAGKKNREIAADLLIAPGTVKIHLMHIFDKLGCSNRAELMFQTLTIQ